MATGYGLGDRKVCIRTPVGSNIVISTYRPHWLWGPPSFHSNENCELFHLGAGGGGAEGRQRRREGKRKEEHRKHIMSPLRAQEFNAISRFVTMVY
jgi:hypothetical protein